MFQRWTQPKAIQQAAEIDVEGCRNFKTDQGNGSTDLHFLLSTRARHHLKQRAYSSSSRRDFERRVEVASARSDAVRAIISSAYLRSSISHPEEI
jgi:hypothetical protein